MEANYALARLTPEQEALLREAETTLGGGLLLAYQQYDFPMWAYVPTDLGYSQLTESQIECLEGLERKLGLVVLAVRQL
jgi:hypothetical protein